MIAARRRKCASWSANAWGWNFVPQKADHNTSVELIAWMRGVFHSRMIPVADAIHYWRQVLPGYRQLQHDLLFEMSEA